MHRSPHRGDLLRVLVLGLGLAPGASAQQAAGDTGGIAAGTRIVLLHGFGAVHPTLDPTIERTFVGINLVMPVHRVDGRRVWLLSTSGSDSGWVDAGNVRPLSGAVEHYTDMLRADSGNWDLLLRRAEAEHALNLRDAATADYSQSIAKHPGEAFLYLRRGRHYQTLKACRNALSDFQTARRKLSTSAHQDYNLRAELLSLEAGVWLSCTTVRDPARGLALARGAQALDPSRATLVTIVAAAYAAIGDYGNAVATQQRALARPDFPPAYRAEAEAQLDVYRRESRPATGSPGTGSDSARHEVLPPRSSAHPPRVDFIDDPLDAWRSNACAHAPLAKIGGLHDAYTHRRHALRRARRTPGGRGGAAGAEGW